MNADLNSEIAKAVDEVYDSESGTLSLGSRLRIWEAMDRAFPNNSHRRRTVLNVLTVQETVLFWWDLAFPKHLHRLPRFFLQLCYQVISGQIDRKQCASILRTQSVDPGEYYPDEEEPMFHDQARAASGVFAAQQAAWSAAYDEFVLNPTTHIDDSTVIHPEPDNWDAFYLSSIVAAGGSEYETTGSTTERRKFWIEWLERKVPTVCGDQTVLENVADAGYAELLRQLKQLDAV